MKNLTEDQKSALKFFTQTAKGSRSSRGSYARQKIAECDVSMASITLFVGQVDAPEGPSIAWTDGNNTYYAPGFEKLSKSEQIGVDLHESMHTALRHPQRGKALHLAHGSDYSHDLYNISCDAIINETLMAGLGGNNNGNGNRFYTLPTKCVLLVELLKESFKEDWDQKEALDFWTAERLYFALKRETSGRGGKGNQGQGQGQGGGKGQKPGTKNQPGNANGAGERAKEYARSKGWQSDLAEPKEYSEAKEAEEANNWKQRLTRAKQAGVGSNGILRHLGADLPESKVPWQHILRAKISNAVVKSVEESFENPARSFLALHDHMLEMGEDFPYLPGIDPDVPVPKIGIAVDTSGSIGPAMLDEFMGEMRRIQRLTRAQMIVAVADDRVHGVFEIDPNSPHTDLGKIEFKGEGGTDFSPAIELLDKKYKVACIVYLTDLCGPANYKPKFCRQVIWAIPDSFGSAPNPPYGTKIMLD